MKNKQHNKKRNSGLLYEFLVRYVSKSLVEGDQKRSSKALRIIKKHFKPGTQLYREFRLINSLVWTTVASTPTAAMILREAQKAACEYDSKKLDREKSLLIRTINHTLNESTFYDQQVENYKTYATIQLLLNEWRENNTLNFAKRAKFEDQVIEWLLSEKKDNSDSLLSEENNGTTKLVMNLMLKKLNEKYSNSLSSEQKDVIRTYVWCTSNDDTDKIKSNLSEVKHSIVDNIDAYRAANTDNVYLVERLEATKEKILAENLDDVNDETVTRFMLYMNLNNELSEKEDE